LDSGMVIDLSLVRKDYARFQPRFGFDESGLKRFLGGEFGGEFVGGLIVEGLFVVPDALNMIDNPYLEPWQKSVQGFSMGTEVFVSAYLGGLAGEWIAASVGGTLGGPVGFIAGVTVGVVVSTAWDYFIEPSISWVFVSLGGPDPFSDVRHLRPLGGY
jgi:hypothetical protein